MNYVAAFIDEREVGRAHFIGSNNITTALGGAQQRQADDGT